MNFNALHGILVSFALALIPISLASELAGKLRGSQEMRIVAWWTLVYAAIATPLAALAGWMWIRMVPDARLLGGDLLLRHMWTGATMTVLLIALVLWRGWAYHRERAPGIAYLVILGILAAGTVYQGNWGRAVAFGEMPISPLNPLQTSDEGVGCH